MNVTRPGEQPPACSVQDCDHPPVEVGGYCDGHKKYFAQRNGTALTPPIMEADDPELLAREAARAAVAEEREYAERRRVKTWRTLENGSRVPETYWTDAELVAIDAQAAEALNTNLPIIGQPAEAAATPTNLDEHLRWYAGHGTPPGPAPQDPERAALKLLKRALRGKLGEGAGRAAWGLVEMLREDR